jgi:hypothetical protein
VRTAATPGWRSLVGHALAAPVEQPSLWLLGTLSFVLRGGIVVMLLPILVLPTQVEVRLMLGGSLGTTGFTPSFWTILGAATIFSTGLVMAVLYALAQIEIAAFDRLNRDPDFDTGTPVRDPGARVRDPGGRVRDLFVIDSLTLIALLLAAVPLAAALGQVSFQEVLNPSSSAPIFDRVVSQLTAPLALVAVAFPLIDSISATWVRGLLEGRSVGSALVGSVGAIVRRPLWVIATTLVAWAALGLALAATYWALTVAWQATRATLLATTSISDMLSSIAPLLVSVLLAGVFVCGLAICGYVAGFRNALWTVTDPRR